MQPLNSIARVRQEILRHRQEVDGLSYDVDARRYPAIRKVLEVPRRRTLKVGALTALGVCIVSGLIFPWYVTLLVIPAVAGVGWFGRLRWLDHEERRVFEEQRQKMRLQIPADLGLPPAVCEAVAKLPGWIFDAPPVRQGPGMMMNREEPRWRTRARAIVSGAVAAYQNLISVHRTDLIPEWVQDNGQVSDRAEDVLVPLLMRVVAVAELHRAVENGSASAQKTADQLFTQLEGVSHAMQEAAALATRIAASPQEAELASFRRQMEHLEQASRFWQDANKELE